MKTLLLRIHRLTRFSEAIRAEGYLYRAERAEYLADKLTLTLVAEYGSRILISAGVLVCSPQKFGTEDAHLMEGAFAV